MKGHSDLGGQVAGEVVGHLGRRHAQRIISDFYAKGIVRGAVECTNLCTHACNNDVIAAETMKHSKTLAQTLLEAGVFPKKMLLIVLQMIARFGYPSEKIGGMEQFAGVKAVTHGFRAIGCSMVCMDFLTVSATDDINKTCGFLRAIMYVLGLLPDGTQNIIARASARMVS